MSSEYGVLRPTRDRDLLASFRRPCKCQRVLRLGSVTARHSSSGRQANFATLNRGRHLHSAGRPSRWALADILVFSYLLIQRQHHVDNKLKNSPVRKWRSTPLEWISSSRELDLYLVSGHTAYRRASVIDLYLQTQCHWNRKKNFFVNGLTAGAPPSSRSRDTKTRTNSKNPAL